MTREEFNRLNELDNIIAWNNPEDRGRDLTPEEREEHTRLFWRLMHGENVDEHIRENEHSED